MIIALDSNIFIYVLEDDESWGQPARRLLRQVTAGAVSGVASTLCLTEVLPYPHEVSPQLGEDAQLFMEGLNGLDYVPMDLEVAIRAGRLRAQCGSKLSTADAIHLASAVVVGADVFITNDHTLLKFKVDGLKVQLLDEPLRLLQASETT